MSKATIRHRGGVSLCRNNSKASHPPTLSLPLLCLKSVQYCQWSNMISPHQGSLFPCMKGLVQLTEMLDEKFQLQHRFQICQYKVNGIFGWKGGDGNQGWDRTGSSCSVRRSSSAAASPLCREEHYSGRWAQGLFPIRWRCLWSTFLFPVHVALFIRNGHDAS